jgi:hypothetical protein
VQVPASPPSRILAALDGDVAWRASTSACPGPGARPELTSDGGSSWKTTDAARPTGITALQRIIITDVAVASFVGSNSQTCSAQFVRTYVAGDDYATNDGQLERSWYLAADGTLHSPRGDAVAPCTSVLSLAPRDDAAAAALCADGTIHATVDAAATWTVVPFVGSPVAISSAADGYVVGVAGELDCAGVRLVTVNDAGESTPAGCMAVPVGPAALSGNVAIATAAQVTWVWAGETIAASSDNGMTWLQR